jgi:uncharacterized coiled-coil protein SlyX
MSEEELLQRIKALEEKIAEQSKLIAEIELWLSYYKELD